MDSLQKEIIVIPALEELSLKSFCNRQLRVASYSRVSTDFEEQLTSFHSQKAYYTDLILRTPNWKFAGTYADEGISGASVEKRAGFKRMIKHCMKGKIDLIITKSISRFARNTLDSIKYVRKLKAKGIGVLFEKENINTLEENSEVVLTILASLAQEELNSLSQNVKIGIHMAMQEGKVTFQYKRMYAYCKGPDGQPQIIPEQGEIVKRIYSSYLAGQSVLSIMRALNKDKIPSPQGVGEWKDGTIRNILENERYCGDVILQKTFIESPFTKKVKKNNGELPKVYIKNNHVAIIPRSIYEMAQQEHAKRGSKRKVSKVSITEQGKYSSLYALNEILVCGHCGSAYKRTVWTKRSGEKQPVWRCYSRMDNGIKYCTDSVTVDEESLHSAIVSAINATRGSRHDMIPYLTSQLERTLRENAIGEFDVEQVENRINELKTATMELITQSINGNCVGENEGKLKNMSDEIKLLCDMVEQYKAVANKDDSIQNRMDAITQALENEPEEKDVYNDILVRQLIQNIRVMSENKLEIIFKCGLRYEQEMQLKVRKLRKTA